MRDKRDCGVQRAAKPAETTRARKIYSAAKRISAKLQIAPLKCLAITNRPAMTDEIPFEHVTPQEAKEAIKKAEAEAEAQSIAPRPRNHHRTPPPASAPNIKVLMPWIAGLPAELRPHELIVHYARIANRLAELWKYPLACEKFMSELMIDERGDRQGFPDKVAHELAALHLYYTTNVVKQHFDAWGERIGD